MDRYFYNYLCNNQEIIINGLNHAAINEAIDEAKAFLEKMENLFREA